MAWKSPLFGLLVVLLLGLPVRSAEPSQPVNSAWYVNRAIAWNCPMQEIDDEARTFYERLLDHLPAGQSRAFEGLSSLDVVPLDVSEGLARPRIRYIQAFPSDRTLGRYAAFPDVEYLDLWWSSEISDKGLPDLSPGTVSSLTLPWEIGDAGLAALLAKPKCLPRLRHLEIPVQGKLSPTALRHIETSLPQVRSLHLTGKDADEWVVPALANEQLRGLRLSRTSLGDRTVRAIADSGLTHLSLSGLTRVRTEQLRPILEMPGLKELHLAGPTAWSRWRSNHTEHWVIDDGVMAVISRHPGIERLVIEGDRWVGEESITTPPWPEQLAAMPSLKTLVLVWWPDKKLEDAARQWEQKRTRRRAYTRTNTYFGGWIDGLEGQWVQDRAYHAERYPWSQPIWPAGVEPRN